MGIMEQFFGGREKGGEVLPEAAQQEAKKGEIEDLEKRIAELENKMGLGGFKHPQDRMILNGLYVAERGLLEADGVSSADPGPLGAKLQEIESKIKQLSSEEVPLYRPPSEPPAQQPRI